MYSRPGKQKGMTAIGWLLIIVIVGIMLFALIKLFPVYLEAYKISDSMNSLAKASSSRGKDPRALQHDFLTRLNINMVYDIKADDISITSNANGGYSMEVDYEPRVHFIGNLYFLAIFDKTVVIPGSGGSNGS